MKAFCSLEKENFFSSKYYKKSEFPVIRDYWKKIILMQVKAKSQLSQTHMQARTHTKEKKPSITTFISFAFFLLESLILESDFFQKNQSFPPILQDPNPPLLLELQKVVDRKIVHAACEQTKT